MSNPKRLSQRNYGSYAIAASVLCLSASIGYFALQLASLEKVAESMALYRDVAPTLVKEVAQITEKIPFIINEVTAVRGEIPAILAEIAAVRAEIPSVLAEVAAVRAKIPEILIEVSALRRETIPAVLVETSMLQKITVPSVLAESKALRSEAVPGLIAESTALREKTIPAVLIEVKTTREELPALLAQANEIARSAGKSASEGAVSGIFSGIISAPLNLVTGVTGSVFQGKSLSEEERRLIAIASDKVLSKDYLQASETWSNSEMTSSGNVTITAMSVNRDERCRALTIKGYKKKASLGTTIVNVCHDSTGKWAIRK
jgi:surface antigen